MVSEEGVAPSPLRREGEIPDACGAIPIRFLTICGNDHGYDASRYSACPNCGSFERIMVEKALGPEILHRRITEALAFHAAVTAAEKALPKTEGR